MRAFTDVQFMTAAQKGKVLRAWERFLKGGLKYALFTEALYHHLSQHCSFIAHFNRGGFWSTYFEHPEDTVKFFTQFDPDGPGQSVEYGGAWWIAGPDGAYADINGALREACRPYLKAIREGCTTRIRERDLATAKALLEKHGKVMP